MHLIQDELSAIEVETFEIEDLTRIDDSMLASVAAPVDNCSCTFTSTHCSCWTSSSTSCW